MRIPTRIRPPHKIKKCSHWFAGSSHNGAVTAPAPIAISSAVFCIILLLGFTDIDGQDFQQTIRFGKNGFILWCRCCSADSGCCGDDLRQCLNNFDYNIHYNVSCAFSKAVTFASRVSIFAIASCSAAVSNGTSLDWSMP